MLFCCCRGEKKKEFKKEYARLPSNVLTRKRKVYERKKQRHCIMGTIYAVGSVAAAGLTVATCGMDSFVTVPTAIATGTESVYRFDEMKRNSAKIESIDTLLAERNSAKTESDTLLTKRTYVPLELTEDCV